MKLKYIFSMFAGLISMAAISCSEKTTTDIPAAEAAAEKIADATSITEAAEAPSAYYVMFKGDGG